jgi:hypothetical protein
MSSTILLLPRAQLCIRYCSNKHTHIFLTLLGMPSQQTRSDNTFRFKHTAFYMGLKSRVGLVAAKASALRINLNIQGCSVVAPSLPMARSLSHSPSSPPPSFTQYPSPPWSLVRDGQTRRRLPCRRDSSAPLDRTNGGWLSFGWL